MVVLVLVIGVRHPFGSARASLEAHIRYLRCRDQPPMPTMASAACLLQHDVPAAELKHFIDEPVASFRHRQIVGPCGPETENRLIPSIISLSGLHGHPAGHASG